MPVSVLISSIAGRESATSIVGPLYSISTSRRSSSQTLVIVITSERSGSRRRLLMTLYAASAARLTTSFLIPQAEPWSSMKLGELIEIPSAGAELQSALLLQANAEQQAEDDDALWQARWRN